jgi:hypothetical protein
MHLVGGLALDLTLDFHGDKLCLVFLGFLWFFSVKGDNRLNSRAFGQQFLLKIAGFGRRHG